MGQIRGIYEALELPDFQEAEPALRRYVEGLAGYQKNVFLELPTDLRECIAKEWWQCLGGVGLSRLGWPGTGISAREQEHSCAETQYAGFCSRPLTTSASVSLAIAEKFPLQNATNNATREATE